MIRRSIPLAKLMELIQAVKSFLTAHNSCNHVLKWSISVHYIVILPRCSTIYTRRLRGYDPCWEVKS